MGSGKTTTVLRTTDRLNASGIPAIGITEGTNPHPIRYDWDHPWSDVRVGELVSGQVAKWHAYVAGAQATEQVTLVDGQLFHGNLTSLFLLEAAPSMIAGYCREIVGSLTPLSPHLVYFRQDDVAAAIRAISAERGTAWVDYQTNWKLTAPYAVRRGLTGLDGLIALYRAYRALTDQLFDELDIPKLCIENSRREWPEYDRLIDQFLGRTPPQSGLRT